MKKFLAIICLSLTGTLVGKERLTTIGIPDSPLYIAARDGDTQTVTDLLNQGADPNIQRNDDGFTPLYGAAMLGYTQTITELLNHGADPNLQDNRGLTPVSLARNIGNEQIARLLEEAIQQRARES